MDINEKSEGYHTFKFQMKNAYLIFSGLHRITVRYIKLLFLNKNGESKRERATIGNEGLQYVTTLYRPRN